VQVNVTGKTVLIRKTTAIWLFQETERVSTDRLFRVRIKQPFTTTPTTITSYATPCASKSSQIDSIQSQDTLIIEDNNDTKQDAVPKEISLKSTEWVHIRSYKLTLAEKAMLTNNHWLSDLHLNAVQELLKIQFPHIGGLRNTVTVIHTMQMQPLPKGSIQTLHVCGNHWIVASTYHELQ